LLPKVEAALAGGLRAVQLRDKASSGIAIYRQAAALRELTLRYDALLLVNGRVDVAAACGADGVHLGAQELPPLRARALLGSDAWIGYSAHAGDAASSWHGADFVTYSPVFASPGKGKPLGTGSLAAFIGQCNVPAVALGGVTCENAAAAVQAGAAGVAVIREVFDAPDPAQAARNLVAIVQETFDGAKSGS
jgi:thiamine-phosphate pyrophosphorylase